jgi:hypothetical protein
MKSTANSAAHTAALAAQVAAQQGRSAASSMNAGIQAGTHSARNWIAPRLESAADYTTSTAAPVISTTLTKTVAPRVSAALRTTARQVRTQDAKRGMSLRSVLTWTALSAAALAAAGAAATLVWRRYRDAMAADSEPDTVIHSASDEEDGSRPAEGPQVPGETEAPSPAPHEASSNW